MLHRRDDDDAFAGGETFGGEQAEVLYQVAVVFVEGDRVARG
jgi:hypothetical protein